MILDIFKDTIEYSFNDWKTLLKVGLLSCLSILFIPLIFLSGYSYRITSIGINGMINGNDPLPNFKKWSNLFIEGIKLAIVKFVYLLPGTIVFLIFSTKPYGLSALPDFPSLTIEFGIVAITISLWLIFYLFSTVAIPNMINNNGSLKSAFNIREIIAIIKSIGVGNYIKFYASCIVLLLGLASASIFLIMLIALITGFFSLVIFSSLVSMEYVVATIIAVLTPLILVFLIYPFFMIFESRAIALMYNMREIKDR